MKSKEAFLLANSNITATFRCDIHKVWDVVTSVEHYSTWRSDLSKTKILNEKQFVEYTKKGYATTFTITVIEPVSYTHLDVYKRQPYIYYHRNIKTVFGVLLTGIFSP